MVSFEGGCHCGAVRFRVEVEELEAIVCNCSMCTKKGFVHVIVEKERFALLAGEDALSTYSFNTRVARHMFCRTCGIHPFYVPRSHPDGWDVNARCLDGDAARQFRLRAFDGAHWEEHVNSIR